MHFLRQRPGWTGATQANIFVTTVLIFGALRERLQAIDAVDSGACRVDTKLFSDMYRSWPQRSKVELIRTPATYLLDPGTFRHVFLDVYRRARPTDKRGLALTLNAFLARNPDRARDFQDVILELFRSQHTNLRMLGAYIAGSFLDDLSEPDLQRFRQMLKRPSRGVRPNALLGLRLLLARHRFVSARVANFCFSDEVKAIVEEIRQSAPESDIKRSATHYLTMWRKLSRARSRLAAGRASQPRVRADHFSSSPYGRMTRLLR